VPDPAAQRTERPPFSAKRAALHVGIALGVLILAGVIAVAAGVVKNPSRFGQGLGRFGAFLILGTLGISFLAQTGRRRAAWITAGATLATLAVLVAAVVGLSGRARSARILTPAEKADLVQVSTGGERRLRHPSLGFSVLDPGPGFHPSARVASILRAESALDRGTCSWAWRRNSDGAVFLVRIVKGLGATRSSFEGFLRGMRGSLTQAGRGEVTRWKLEWTDRLRQADLDVLARKAVHARHRAYAVRLGPERTPYIVVVGSIARDPAALEPALYSLRLP